jgi:serine/threonine protein kinase
VVQVTRPDKITTSELPVRLEQFEVQALLGEGGMARVFRVEPNEATGFPRACALKVLRREHSKNDPDLAKALRREGRVGGLMLHPHIVETYEIGQVHGQPWILMELVLGPTVEQLLERRRRLATRVAVTIAEHVCRGLHHAHCATNEKGRHLGLVHRDLKPSNVILTPDGQAKVMDFGIAKIPIMPGMTTKPGELKGSPRFMSPEQVGGERLDLRSDVFSVGTLLYEMITGEALFASGSVHGVWMRIVDVQRVLNEDPSFKRIANKYPELAGLMRHCLQPKPADRPDTALDVADALRSFSEGLPPGKSLRAILRENSGWAVVPQDLSVGNIASENFQSRPGARRPKQPVTIPEKSSRPEPRASLPAEAFETIPNPPIRRPKDPVVLPLKTRPSWVLPAAAGAAIVIAILGYILLG